MSSPTFDAPIMQRRAAYYVGLGMALTPIKWGSKLPCFGAGWNKRENLIFDAAQAQRVWAKPLNIGVQLGASKLVSFDLDDEATARPFFEARGLNLDALLAAHPHPIRGNGLRFWFRQEEGCPISSRKHHTVNGVCGFEVRGGDGFQDVAPGSLHPDGFLYTWAKTPPRNREDLPTTPAWVTALYLELANRGAAQKPARAVSVERPTFQGESPIERFNSTYTASEQGEKYGLKPQGSRWLSPNSSTGQAGVSAYMDNGKQRLVTYHGSDDWADGHGHDAFDLFCHFEHGGDVKAAVKAAAELFGMARTDSLTPAESSPAPLTVQDAARLWSEYGSEVLGKAGEYLTARQMHHHSRESVINLLAYSYQSAGEGNLTPAGSDFSLVVGGLKAFAALVGGRPSDLRARLETLADLGMLGSYTRVDPADPQSAHAIRLPADPRTLPFLGHTPTPTQPPVRPQTKNVREPQKFTSPPVKPREAKAEGYVNSGNPINPLRALLRMVLQLSGHSGHPAEWHAARLGLRLNTARKQLAQLAELGYLTDQGKLTCTYRQFFEDMRAWNAERASRRLIKVFDRQQNFANHTLTLARLGVEEAKKKTRRMKALAERCAVGIIRLLDGEAPHTVLGRAA